MGIAVLVILVASSILAPLPESFLLALILLPGALYLDLNDLRLNEKFRFFPSVPLLLSALILPDGGVVTVTLVVLLHALAKTERPFLENLSLRGSLALTALLVTGIRLTTPEADRTWILTAVAVATYTLLRTLLEAGWSPPQQDKERALWRQLKILIRPLEISLALSTVAVVAAIEVSPWTLLAFVPLLKMVRLAAENVLLRAQDETVGEALRTIKSLEHRERRTHQQLSRMRNDKEVIEHFHAQLSSAPDLASTAGTLISTVGRLLPVNNAVLFLGAPPTPFSYQVSEDHSQRLQGAPLTGLREPVVDLAARTGKRQVRRQKQNREILLSEDRLKVAYPIGQLAVLYLGFQEERSLTAEEKERIAWLAEKAGQTLQAAYTNHREQQERQRREAELSDLQERVEKLSLLIRGAEAVAGSMQPHELYLKFLDVVKHSLPHDMGRLTKADGSVDAWGQEFSLDPQPAQEILHKGRPRLVSTPGGPASLVISPICAGQRRFGWIALGSDEPNRFSSEHRDQLFILCSQLAMALSNASLYQDVVRARKELEESQAYLVQSSKMSALGQLAAGVAHELNSPMGAISITLDESLELVETDPGLAKRLLERGRAALARANIIIERLMTYTRKPTHHYELLDLNLLVRETLDFIRYQFDKYRVEVDAQLQGSFSVQGEYQALQQALTNLLLNAAQSMEALSEKRKIEVSLVREGQMVAVLIRDRGPGIPVELRERIFEPFFTTKKLGEGTGLGLWVSSQILTEHGGHLTIRSTNSNGTVFALELPLAQNSSTPPPSAIP